MQKSNPFIGWILIIAAFIIYIGGAIFEIYISYRGHTSHDSEWLDATISSINALLLANFGAVLGFAVKNPSSSLASSMMLTNVLNRKERTDPITEREKIQQVAVIIFLVVMLASIIVYSIKQWQSSADDVLPFVSQSAKMFIAVLIAYLAFILGVQQNRNANNNEPPNDNQNEKR